MLTLDLRRIMADRGIDYPVRYLQKHGISDYIASRLMRGKVASPGADTLEKLCIALNCTPAELFRWEPDAGMILPPSHALHKLVYKEDAGALVKSLRELPPEKLDELREFVKGLEGK